MLYLYQICTTPKVAKMPPDHAEDNERFWQCRLKMVSLATITTQQANPLPQIRNARQVIDSVSNQDLTTAELTDTGREILRFTPILVCKPKCTLKSTT
jgi:hypothetical protein